MTSVLEFVRCFLGWCLNVAKDILGGLLILIGLAAMATAIHAGWLCGIDLYLSIVRFL